MRQAHQQASPARGTFAVRRFGLGWRDLDVDFSRPPGPRLVTEVLVCSATASAADSAADDLAQEEAVWDLEVGQRIAALLRAALGPGQAGLAIDLTCQNAACAQRMDLELPLADLERIQQQAPELVSVPLAQGACSLRRPTGRDQLAWQQAAAQGQPLTLEQILRGLLVEGAAPGTPLPLAALEAALDAADPLVNFSLQVTCPYCAQAGAYALDLQALALAQLRQIQQRLLRAVHSLASRYHWSEGEILALPEWRRAQYLALIEQEQDLRV